jgi:hypothetical protein
VYIIEIYLATATHQSERKTQIEREKEVIQRKRDGNKGKNG